ncbi:apoptosis regulator BAX-like [Coregonus clupeaformis]|uniref:apoptosis regulator BAX-like n=1 Tax=Coregonus clupeaformis TaxID=59861 RepID=UPI001BE0BAB7|nr:apoptosis regulator BAX-like [Coregonus clupeaformis]
MADVGEREETGGGEEACGEVGGEDCVVDDRIMELAAVILRGYIIERFRAEGIQLSPEELGGTPSELQDHGLKKMVDMLLETTEELNRNAELQHLISEVQVNCIQDVLISVAKEIFTDGINWGRVASLNLLAYTFIHKAHTQNQPQVMVNIINWVLQFIRENLNSWISQEVRKAVRKVAWWCSVTLLASLACAAAIAYWRKHR